MSDHRWQGYAHPELFEQINQGPGAAGSADSVRRWSELTRALGDIDTGLASALITAMGGWQGVASDSARNGIRPLGEWAEQAQQAADAMRDRAEQQAGFVSKARSDMPPPVTVTAEEPGAAQSLLTHLFGGQSDYEAQETRQNAAEQRAFEVMRTYEASTEANTTSLASFAPPPQVVVDAPSNSGASPSSPGQQNVTISWGAGHPVPAARMSSESATARGTNPTGRHDRTSQTGGARGSAPAAGASEKSSRRGRDEPVDRQVTEEYGRSDGFFDEPHTSSRPVIGGDSR